MSHLDHPYLPADVQWLWLRGNLHTHSDRSDGASSPQAMVDAYAERGYGFLALTDHDVFADFTNIDPRGMVLLEGAEITFAGGHLLQLGGKHRIDPNSDRQLVIDQAQKAGALAVLNHPNFMAQLNHYSYEELLRFKDYVGIEVFNGVCLGHAGSAYALEKWDRLLASGKHVWGFATDDAHQLKNVGCGWIVLQVQPNERNSEGILKAIKAGRFYGSSGVTIERIACEGSVLKIVAPDAEAMEVIGEAGKRFHYVEARELSFDTDSVQSFYVRVQCYGYGRKQAWTQPFFIRGGALERKLQLEEQILAGTLQNPQLNALKVSGTPTLQTLSQSDQWLSAPESKLNYELGTAAAADVVTRIKALVSDTHLVLRVQCDEPLMEKMTVKIQDDNNPSLWTDESLEFFLDVESTGERYHHMIVNPLGKFYAIHHTGWARDLKHECLTQRGKDHWVLYLSLRLDSLGPKVKTAPGTRYGFHVCRNRKTVGKHYLWSWVGGSNHTPARFGLLQI